MRHHEIIELSVSVFTLSLSLYLAFGPLRNRLPRFITRFAKYSVALKLLGLSVLCWYSLYMNIHVHGSLPIRWMLVVLGATLLGGSVFILVRKPAAAPPKRTLNSPPA